MINNQLKYILSVLINLSNYNIIDGPACVHVYIKLFDLEITPRSTSIHQS